MPQVYLRNRLISLSAWTLEAMVRRSEPAYEKQAAIRSAAKHWEPPRSSDAIEHPDVPGLFLLRQAIPPEAVAAIRSFVADTILPPRDRGVHADAEAADREAAVLLSQAAKLPHGSESAIEAYEQASAAIERRDKLRAAAAQLPQPRPIARSSRQWEWFTYEPGRWMAPMLAHPNDAGLASADAQRRHLSDFEVFGRAPVDEWLRLDALSEEQPTSSGAEWLRHLQRTLPTRLPCVASLASPLCSFHQFQLLERGCTISPHIDAPTPPAEVVATLSLGTGSRDSVRVGPATLQVVAGDVYAISGKARWDVTHEVHSSTNDRLSVTLRFAAAEDLR